MIAHRAELAEARERIAELEAVVGKQQMAIRHYQDRLGILDFEIRANDD